MDRTKSHINRWVLQLSRGNFTMDTEISYLTSFRSTHYWTKKQHLKFEQRGESRRLFIRIKLKKKVGLLTQYRSYLPSFTSAIVRKCHKEKDP